MAGRTHVDSAVAERRLRPIYDWLDNNNNKKALQEADKVLKKQPNFLCAKVLKGLAYLRMGKEGECQALLDAVRVEEPSDDSTLQAMSICYRELHQPQAVVEAYQAAVRKCPANEELLTHLFMAYVRVGDLKKQQAQALALYRLRPKNPYYFWAVMSIVMQAQAGDGAGTAISLALAERMVAKLCQEGRIEAEQEVHLYLMILEMQGKIAQALDVLNGPLAEKLVSLVSVPTKRCQLLVELERWREANALVKTLLLQDINQWAHYKTYLDTGFRLVDELASQPASSSTISAAEDTKTKVATEESKANVEDGKTNVEADDSSANMEADDSWTKMAAFLERLQGENRLRERAERGPALARLEMFRRLHERNLPAENWLGPALHLLLAFVVKFGDRPCCVADVRPFLELVPKSQRQELLELLAENVDLPATGDDTPALSQQLEAVTLGGDESPHNPCTDKTSWWLPQQVDGSCLPETRWQMLRHVVALQLSRCVGARAQGEPSKHALRLEALHSHGSALCLQATPTEFRCNDGYALLAAHAHLDVWLETRADLHIVRALAVLRRAAAESAHNFHVKLLQLRVLQEIGAGLAAHQAYAALDVKHVQLDSMGHLHCAHLAGTGLLTQARELLDHTLKFFASNHKDSVEHLTFSYKFGSFGKIAEFCAFRARLHASAHRALSSACSAILQLCCVRDIPSARTQLEAARTTAQDILARVETLTDNRDLSLLVIWNPPHKCISDNGRAASFAVHLDFVRLRCLLLLCMADAILGANKANGVDTFNAEDALLALCNRCQHRPEETICAQELLSAPLSSRLSNWPWDATRELAALARKVGVKNSVCSADLSPMAALADSLCADIDAHVNEANPISTTRRLMHRCVSLGEVLSLAALLVASCRAACPATTQRRPRKRRDDDIAPPVGLAEGSVLSTSLAALSARIRAWTAPRQCADADAFDPDVCAAVRTQLATSHMASVQQVSSWLDSRCTFLDNA